MDKKTIQINANLHRRLKNVADKNGHKILWMAERIIANWLDKTQKAEPANNSGIAQIPESTELGNQLDSILLPENELGQKLEQYTKKAIGE